jgi:hypothetical protein
MSIVAAEWLGCASADAASACDEHRDRVHHCAVVPFTEQRHDGALHQCMCDHQWDDTGVRRGGVS